MTLYQYIVTRTNDSSSVEYATTTIGLDFLMVYANNQSYVGMHELNISYTLSFGPSMRVSRQFDYNFWLEIRNLPTRVWNFGPPYFINPIEELVIEEETSLSYKLPKYTDPDIYDKPDVFKIEFDSSIRFGEYKNEVFTFKPKKGDANIYFNKITLKDNNTNPLQNTYV